MISPYYLHMEVWKWKVPHKALATFCSSWIIFWSQHFACSNHPIAFTRLFHSTASQWELYVWWYTRVNQCKDSLNVGYHYMKPLEGYVLEIFAFIIYPVINNLKAWTPCFLIYHDLCYSNGTNHIHVLWVQTTIVPQHIQNDLVCGFLVMTAWLVVANHLCGGCYKNMLPVQENWQYNLNGMMLVQLKRNRWTQRLIVIGTLFGHFWTDIMKNTTQLSNGEDICDWAIATWSSQKYVFTKTVRLFL